MERLLLRSVFLIAFRKFYRGHMDQAFLSIDGQNRLVLKKMQTDDTLLIIRRDNCGVVTIGDHEERR
jgi:hypothetical protein